MNASRRPKAIDGKLGYYSFDAGSPITAGTWRAARASAATAASGAHRLLQTKAKAVFSLCRPPGHHAAADYYGGYCFINNAAVAAQTLCAAGARAAVWDVDYHHGNGTQAIFYTRGDVLFVSQHADPAFEFPFFSGFADESGEGAGAGANLNLPLAAGCEWPAYRDAMRAAAKAISQFGAEVLIVSFGADTFERDPISHFKLRADDFFRLGAELAAPQLPTLFVMEGGYAIDDLGRNVAAALCGFAEA
jgi:acetoin utilization deacetylase AcuC-like enzyme